MTIHKFWEIVRHIDWVTNCRNHRYYDAAKNMLMDKYSYETMREFSNMFDKLKTELGGRISDHDSVIAGRVGNYSGDDSFDDMISHVIGCGEGTYNTVMLNPLVLNEMEFVESFAYCIPHAGDYQYL